MPGIEIKLTTTDDDNNADFLLDSSFNDVGDIDEDLALCFEEVVDDFFLVINS